MSGTIGRWKIAAVRRRARLRRAESVRFVGDAVSISHPVRPLPSGAALADRCRQALVAANAALAPSLLGLGLVSTPAAAKATFFVERTGAANPLAGQTAGAALAAPTVGDLDGGRDLDLVSIDDFGVILYFQSTSPTASPAFIARTGSQNSLAAHLSAGRSARGG